MPQPIARTLRLALLASLAGVLVLALALPAAAQQAPDPGRGGEQQATPAEGGGRWGLGWLLGYLGQILTARTGGAAQAPQAETRAAAGQAQALAPAATDPTKADLDAAQERKRQADLRYEAAQMWFFAEGQGGNPPSSAATTELVASSAERYQAGLQEDAARKDRIDQIKRDLADKRRQRDDLDKANSSTPHTPGRARISEGRDGQLDADIAELTDELKQLGGTDEPGAEETAGDGAVEQAAGSGDAKQDQNTAEGDQAGTGQGSKDDAVNQLLGDGGLGEGGEGEHPEAEEGLVEVRPPAPLTVNLPGQGGSHEGDDSDDSDDWRLGDASAMVADKGTTGIDITDLGITLPGSTRGGVFDNPFETGRGGALTTEPDPGGGGWLGDPVSVNLPGIRVNTGADQGGFGSVFGAGTATMDACASAC